MIHSSSYHHQNDSIRQIYYQRHHPKSWLTVSPASKTNGDSYSDDDDGSMGSDAPPWNTKGADEQLVPHPPPEFVEEGI